ncbi:hypothetical protein E2C01_073242 [Portunus trituberculatus]|uniref:Uncharacterized protein n=1 Tax=Portunus trituberculatus TaxID=210409 RepID=A0A5B7I9B6_PORTR|nr:hypothetical protein [Portunus trituberculatus]
MNFHHKFTPRPRSFKATMFPRSFVVLVSLGMCWHIRALMVGVLRFSDLPVINNVPALLNLLRKNYFSFR